MFANCKVYMNAGHCSKTTNRQRFILVNEITSTIGQDVLICLLASHVISGCDTTSPLFKIGKRTAYNTLVVNIADMLFLGELGQSNDVTNGLTTATKYALLLYGVKGRSCQSLNRLRYNYACKSDKSAYPFPPTVYSLNTKLTCTELCSCNCDECSNRDNFLLLYDSSDDEND